MIGLVGLPGKKQRKEIKDSPPVPQLDYFVFIPEEAVQMKVEEYARYDGVGLAELVKKGEVSPKELAHLCLAAVEKVNPQINAVIETYFERVKAMDDSAVRDGPFAGVPFLMKDLGASEKGKRQESGSRLMKGYVADKDTFLATRFKEAGLTLLGRTTTPEFGYSYTTESILMGPTHNPWNLAMMAGGSSGGSAACVAAGIVPMAHASDSGGSIRVPASACGIVGLKTSRGRVTVGPDLGERCGGLAQEFVVTRSVRDTAVMLDAISQPAPGDPFIIVQPKRPYAREVDAPTGKLRIAWTTQSWQPGTLVNPEVVQCVEQVAAKCDEMGHEVVEAFPVFDYEEYLRTCLVTSAFCSDVELEALAAKMGRTINEETLEPINLLLYHYARGLTAKDMYVNDMLLNKLRRTFGQFFREYDALLTPTMSQLPQSLGKYALTPADLNLIGWNRRLDEVGMYTMPINITGQPAISLPLGQSKSGLPIGVQFVSRFGDEGTLIRLASFFEKAMPWRDHIPPTHVSR